MKYITHSEKETMEIANKFAKKLTINSVVCLNGQMGAGKTTFTKGIMSALKCKDEISSPTFAICHRYSASIPVLHYDLYRLKDEDDLYSTGFFDDIEEQACKIIEWSDIAKNLLPSNTINVDFKYGQEDNERIITIKEGEHI